MAVDNLDAQYKVLLTQLQGLNSKINSFVNAPAGYLVQTDSGPVRTLLGIEQQALANRWVLRVVDMKTVDEAQLYIDSYPEGQLFRIWGECSNSGNRNGIYMKQDGHIVRVNLQEMEDVQDPKTPFLVTKKRTLTMITEDGVKTAFVDTEPLTLNRVVSFNATLTGYAIDSDDGIWGNSTVDGVIKTPEVFGDPMVSVATTRKVIPRFNGLDQNFFSVDFNQPYGNLVYYATGVAGRKIRWVVEAEYQEYSKD